MPFTPAVPLIAALYAALLGVLGAGLTVAVIVKRVRLRVDAGDGGLPEMAQAIRAHANFVEQVPLALLLITLAELLGTRPLALHLLGGVLIVARLLSAFGLSRSLGPTQPRQSGAGMTVLVTLGAAGAILYALLAR